MLHMINKAPDHPRFLQCLQALAAADTLLLTESAVLALADSAFAPPCPWFALATDVEARGLTATASQQRLLDTPGWVQMTVDHEQMMNW